MRFPLLKGLVILSVALDQALAAPSSADWVYPQQARPELRHGHLSRRDDDAVATHSKPFLVQTTAVASARVITVVTPSLGASAISITSQGQIVTSYSALTVCPTTAHSPTHTAHSYYSLTHSIGRSSVTPVSSPTSFNTTYRIARREGSAPNTNTSTIPAPYRNTTTTSVPSGLNSSVTSCSVTYVPTTTAICHTTVTPLGGILMPVLACDQEITFSTDHEIATTASTTELVTVFNVAPWQDVVAGVPTGTVNKEMCNSASQCSTVQETWSISTVTVTQTQTNTLSVNTVVTGPALVILPPSSTLTLTDSTPSTISTSLVYEVYSTSTSLEIVKQTLLGPTTPTPVRGGVPSSTITTTKTSTRTVTLQGITQTSTI